jgi:hypothetical protein
VNVLRRKPPGLVQRSRASGNRIVRHGVVQVYAGKSNKLSHPIVHVAGMYQLIKVFFNMV